MFADRQRSISGLLVAVDMAAALAAFAVAYALRFPSTPLIGPLDAHRGAHLLMGLAVLVAWPLALRLFDLYQLEKLGRPGTSAVKVVAAGLLVALAVGSVLFFFKAKLASRLVLGVALTLTALSAVAARWLVHIWAQRRGAGKKLQILVVGSGAVARRLGARLQQHRELGAQLLGYLRVEGEPVGEEGVPEQQVLGTSADVRRLLDERVVDQVAIAVDAAALPGLEPVVRACEEVGVDVSVVVHVFDRLLTRANLDRVHDLPLVHLHNTPQFRAVMTAKRVFDVALALLLLALTAPLLLLAGLAVKLTSRGPVLFVQERLGLHGRRFRLYKLRTMVEGAHQMLPALEDQNEMEGPTFKMRRDPRVTGVGRLLRRFSIDELPQLINVLKGEMSMVGPRPPLAEEVARYDRWQRRRLSMRPGLTCTWQVSGRSEVDFEEWVRLDLEYIAGWSPWLDLLIVLRTIPAVIGGRGAS